MEGWESFAVAEVGAAAVLAGLVLVGVSVNLGRVIAEPAAPPRGAEALAVLLALLVAASVLLIPGQPRWLVGAVLLLVGTIAWATIVSLQRRAQRVWLAAHPETVHRIKAFAAAHVALGQLATLPFVAGGAALLLGSKDGLYGVALGAFGSFGLAFLDAWVLLIEINLLGGEE
jgi:hypothetical protein